jgi:serine kinase of HPr protein (carbohydrate metabolism regulator)
MNVKKLLECSDFKLINNPSSIDINLSGVFTSDLLSHVMANAKEDNILITILNNINVLGVASLLDLGCVIFSHNTQVQKEIIEKANELDIVLLNTPLSTAEATIKLYQMGIYQ